MIHTIRILAAIAIVLSAFACKNPQPPVKSTDTGKAVVPHKH
jgi:hypothetical protein